MLSQSMLRAARFRVAVAYHRYAFHSLVYRSSPALARAGSISGCKRSSYISYVITAGILLAATTSGIAQARGSDFISTAEGLYANGTGDKHRVYAYVNAYAEANPNNPDALWRLARACHDMAVLADDRAEKRAYVYRAYELAKQAVALAPDDYACHKWVAITLSSIGDYEGTKASIQNAYVVREYFDTALRLNPKDATTHHLLGLWHFTIADLPWYSAKIASALFAAPPTSDFETALACFQTAENLDPGFYVKNALMIGKTLAKLHRYAEAKAWYARVAVMPVHNKDDQVAHDEAEALLKASP